MKRKNKQKIKSIFPTLLISGILISSAGCQAASDLFNPDTYSWNYNKEPWEKNFKRNKTVKTKNAANDY